MRDEPSIDIVPMDGDCPHVEDLIRDVFDFFGFVEQAGAEQFGIGESRTEDLDDDIGISMRIPKGEILSGVGQLEISISVGFSRFQNIVFFEEGSKSIALTVRSFRPVPFSSTMLPFTPLFGIFCAPLTIHVVRLATTLQ